MLQPEVRHRIPFNDPAFYGDVARPCQFLVCEVLFERPEWLWGFMERMVSVMSAPCWNAALIGAAILLWLLPVKPADALAAPAARGPN